MPVADDGTFNHNLAFAASSEGALGFLEELQVRESDWEVADKNVCVAWVVMRHDQIDCQFTK